MERRGELSTFVHPTASPRVGYFYMDLCLVHGIQLCYNKSEIRAALRAMCDTTVFRTHCRSETDENPIRAAKCCFEPRGTRLPDARISKPHPRKGTETTRNHKDSTSNNPISKPHPRKGTETMMLLLSKNNLVISKPHPRKGTETHEPIMSGSNASEFQNHIPARGRKLLHFFTSLLRIEENFKTTSPQGDGNMFFASRTILLNMISKPHPRKGTAHTRGVCPLFFYAFLGSL